MDHQPVHIDNIKKKYGIFCSQLKILLAFHAATFFFCLKKFLLNQKITTSFFIFYS